MGLDGDDSIYVPMQSCDDLTAVTHIHPGAFRAAIGRLLKRDGVSRLVGLMPAGEGEAGPKKTFKDYAPGHLHIDLKELPRMPDEADKAYLCVAIDRARPRVYFEILPDKTARAGGASSGGWRRPARSRSRRS